MLIIGWIVLCFVVAWAASQKGRSGVGYFFLSLFLSPLIGLLVLIVVPSKVAPLAAASAAAPALKPSSSTGDYIVCPSCRRANSAVFRTCSYCNQPLRPEPERTKRCPSCAEEILAAARKCRYCGTDQPIDSVVPLEAPLPNPQPRPLPAGYGLCPDCRKQRPLNSERCLKCLSTLKTDAA